MALLLKKTLMIFMFIVCCWSEDIHTDDPPTNSVCSNETESEHCETITMNSNLENGTEFSNFSTIDEENTNSSVTSEVDDSRITSTKEPETTVPPSSTVPTIASTSRVRSTLEPSYDMHFIPEDICSCDMTMECCDINCCCDEDCTASDRQAFSFCFKRPPIAPDPRYCYQTNFVYRNNTEYKMVQTREGLFCILWDNLPSETRYMKRKVVTKLEDFSKLYERRQFYEWPTNVPKNPVFQPLIYRAGNIVWTISNTSISPLALPNKLVSAFCGISTPIHYLIDWSGSCSSVDLACSENNGLSASTYYGSFFVIAMPQLMNHSQVLYFLEQQECSYNICLPFDLFLCSSDSRNTDDCLAVDDIEVPFYDNETNMCSNVVKEVKYRIYHNGTFGIARAEAYIWVISLKSTQSDLRQSFSVEFHWIDSPTRLLHRSGNPGYIVGKPVIAGQKIFRVSESENEPDKEAILLSQEQSKWLTFSKPGMDGLCINSMAEGNRIPVNFGENLITSCFMELSISNFFSQENCSFLQKNILHMMLGDAMINVTESKQFNMYVATFGDAKVEETGDWVPVLLENMPILTIDWKQEGIVLICKSVVTSLHINIVTSKVGLATKPQIKILGVAITFGFGRDLTFDCSPSLCSNFNLHKKQKFEIQSSVSFVDVSKPPVVHFAEPPVYEVKLPYDFFYPFLSSCSIRSLACCFHVLLVLLFSFCTFLGAL